jgi:hypothetical protein
VNEVNDEVKEKKGIVMNEKIRELINPERKEETGIELLKKIKDNVEARISHNTFNINDFISWRGKYRVAKEREIWAKEKLENKKERFKTDRKKKGPYKNLNEFRSKGDNKIEKIDMKMED